jgi:uncharacterized LabA/DUF88 family protein
LVPATHRIAKVKYFTARVSGVPDRDAPKRQNAYLSALRTVPEIEVHFGNFLSKTIWRPIATLPVANETISSPNPVILPAGLHSVTGTIPQILPVGSYPPPNAPRRTGPVPHAHPDAVKAEVHTKEEKGSDVNLAAHLLNDAWKNHYDAAVVISNDTDLTTPIRMVAQERGKAVFVVCPGRWPQSPKLTAVATYVRHIRGAMLRASQFPNPVAGIHKPASW